MGPEGCRSPILRSQSATVERSSSVPWFDGSADSHDSMNQDQHVTNVMICWIDGGIESDRWMDCCMGCIYWMSFSWMFCFFCEDNLCFLYQIICGFDGFRMFQPFLPLCIGSIHNYSQQGAELENLARWNPLRLGCSSCPYHDEVVSMRDLFHFLENLLN